jgi:hypothetical protein
VSGFPCSHGAKTRPADYADVLQYEVVTADGKIKIANECKNKDLFWAMRGGGGTFGVSTRVWLKTFPAFKAVNTVTGGIVCKDRNSYKNMVGTLMDLQKPLRQAGFTVRIRSESCSPLRSYKCINVSDSANIGSLGDCRGILRIDSRFSGKI